MLNTSSSSPWLTDLWHVSPWNFHPGVLGSCTPVHQLCLHDVTLREGSQFSGVELDHERRIAIARSLAGLGVGRIEVGRISDNEEENQTIRAICGLGLPSVLYGFTEHSVRAVENAARCGVTGVIVCFIGPEYQRTEFTQGHPEKVVDLAKAMVAKAREVGLAVSLFPTDATREDPERYRDMVSEIESEAGFDSLVWVDSRGTCGPFAIPAVMDFLRKTTQAPIEAHFHNDFGVATANTLTAAAHGAQAAHVSIFGLGERAGNAVLEEVALGAKLFLGCETGVNLSHLVPFAEEMRRVTRFQPATNAPVIGSKIFDIEFDLNQTAYFLARDASAATKSFPYRWDLVGQKQPELVVGYKNGLQSLDLLLSEMDVKLTDQEKDSLLQVIQSRSLAEGRSFNAREVLDLLRNRS